MTKNERRMMVELAKSMTRLGDMMVILQKHVTDESILRELNSLLADNQAGTKHFLDLASEEWFGDE